MLIDQDRIQAILNEKHAYYASHDAIRRDSRWFPYSTDLFEKQLTPTSRVLDIGCGNGSTLLEIPHAFQSAVGIDNDPEHIQLAETARLEQGVTNVEFLLLDFPGETARLQPESFDLVFSLRGPLGDSPRNIQAALSLLRRDGLLYCEEIGDQHQREVREIFDDPAGKDLPAPAAPLLKTLMQSCGVDVRLVQDVFTQWIYPDVYAWFGFTCNLWTWLGRPLPAPDDPRIGQFASRNSNSAGEIVTTHHVVIVAGVKPQ